MVTAKNKGGDVDKDVYRYTILEYLTAELGTKGDEELDTMIKTTIAGRNDPSLSQAIYCQK